MLNFCNSNVKFLQKIGKKFISNYKLLLKLSCLISILLIFFIPSFFDTSMANSLLPNQKSQDPPSIDEEISPLISSFSTGLGPFSVAAGDLDGDLVPDLAVANFDANTLSVLRNTSNLCAINFAPQIVFPTGASPASVAIGDFDGDGKMDLAVANLISNTISVLRNTGSPNSIAFAPQVTFPVISNPSSIAINDIDGDGKMDLAVANQTDNSVSVLRNTSTIGIITFASQVRLSVGSSPRSVSAGDIDGDGKVDLAVANFNSNTVSVLRNTSIISVITFDAQVTFPTNLGPIAVSVGELNNDGKVDLAVTNFNSNTVSAFRNIGSAGVITFAPQVTFPTSASPNSVVIGDLDGDGKGDLATTNQTNVTVSVFRNTSAAFKNTGTTINISFASKIDFPSGSNPISAKLSDFNGDGKLDFAFANRGNASTSVLRNTSGFIPISFDVPIGILPSNLPSGQVNVKYSQTLSGLNGKVPYSFSLVAGELPPGLGILPAGSLFGIPSLSGTFSFTLQATDSSGCSSTVNYTLVING